MAAQSSGIDPYEALGLTQSASMLEIRGAYLRLAKLWHPDVNASPEAHAKFQAIRAAYDLLRDPVAREHFHQQIAAAQSRSSLEAYRRQQAQRRKASQRRRDRNMGLGGWWKKR